MFLVEGYDTAGGGSNSDMRGGGRLVKVVVGGIGVDGRPMTGRRQSGPAIGFHKVGSITGQIYCVPIRARGP